MVDVLPEGELLFRHTMWVPVSFEAVVTLGLPALAAGVPLGRGENPPILLLLTGMEPNSVPLNTSLCSQ